MVLMCKNVRPILKPREEGVCGKGTIIENNGNDGLKIETNLGTHGEKFQEL